MKQNMKRALLVLCMAVCFFTLSACGSRADVTAEPIPQTIVDTMKSGAENYLMQFDSYDDAKIDSELKRVQKQKNSVMESALTSWKSIKGDLGKMAGGEAAFLSEEVERVSDDSYRIKVRVNFELKELLFTLSAKEVTGSDYSGGMALLPTELVFAPNYTTGEKLTRAALNTAMGMGTVFAVLIFISFIISTLKGVNTWEAKLKAAKEAKEQKNLETEQVAAPIAPPAPALSPISALSPAPAALPVPMTAVLEPAPAAEICEEENLTDDMELAAVITAAIAAAQCVPVEGLVVRSIRRKPASTWKNA